MKKVVLICVAFLALYIGNLYAQSSKDLVKERKEMAKMTREQVNNKASKAARKEAKKIKKEGWMTSPGALPIDKQLDKSYNMQYQVDESGYPQFMMGEAMSIGQNYDGAKMQAMELAKQNLAGQIQTEITMLVDNTVANNQLEPEEAATVTKSVMASKNLISQSIGRVITIVEMYRTLPNRNKEVMVRIAYNSEMAKEVTKKIIKKDLEAQGEQLHGKLDKLLNW